MRQLLLAAMPVICVLLSAGISRAQRFANDWMTAGYDAQRSSWVRSDAKISKESLQQPGFELVWKLKLEISPRQLNTLTPPSLLDFYIGYRGFRSLGFFGAASDRVIAIDTDLARIEWEKDLAPAGRAPSGTLSCPGGMTSAVTRPTGTAYPMVPTGRGAGRGTPARSGVGLPYEGAVTLKSAPAPAPPKPPVAAAKPGSTAAEPPNPFAPRVQWALALTGDGKLHSMWVSNGHEPNPAVQFLQPQAHATGLIAFDNTAYAATTNGCCGVEDGLWALDLTAGKVSRWKSPVKGVAGFAAGPDGTIYAASGSELTALTARTLEPRSSYKSGGAAFSSSPVVFEFKGRDLAAVAASDGRLHLVDTASLNRRAPLDKTAPFTSLDYPVRSLASWQDPSGTRWIFGRGLRPHRRNPERRHCRLEADREGRRSISGSRLDLRRSHLAASPAGHPWRRLCAVQRRVSLQRRKGDRRTLQTGRVVCAGCGYRQDAVEQRRHDHLVCPQRRPGCRGKPRLRGNLRWHAVCVRLPDRALM